MLLLESKIKPVLFSAFLEVAFNAADACQRILLVRTVDWIDTDAEIFHKIYYYFE